MKLHMLTHHHIYGAAHMICMNRNCLTSEDVQPCDGDDCWWYGEGGYEAWKKRL